MVHKRVWNIKKRELIDRLQELYDDNKLSDKDEDTVIKTIDYLGGKINW
jgi:hypothetical protein